jgi:hypothetical protein
MRNAAIFLLVVAVGALGIFAYYQQASLREQRRLVQELTARLEPASKTANIDLQQKCARQAREAFSHDYLGSLEPNDPFTNFENHYNGQLGKCFILITKTIINPRDNTESKSGMLSDAFEGKDYASYFSTYYGSSRGTVLSLCSVTLPSGEKRACHSSDEFDDLIKGYMQ